MIRDHDSLRMDIKPQENQFNTFSQSRISYLCDEHVFLSTFGFI